MTLARIASGFLGSHSEASKDSRTGTESSMFRLIGCVSACPSARIARGVQLLLLCAALSSTACVQMKSMWNGMIDPSQVGHFGNSPLPGAIRKTLTIHDDPVGVPGAEEPRPDDLVVEVEDYRLGPGDTVQIAIYELIERQRYEPFRRTISESGNIDLPVVGRIDSVVGMTESDLTEAIAGRLTQLEVLEDPFVDVVVLERQQRTFSISGGVPVVGEYPIIRPNYRLMDALIAAGDASPDLKDVYVYRSMSEPAPAPASDSESKVDGANLTLAAFDPGPSGRPPSTKPAATQATLNETARKELLEAAAPAPARGSVPDTPAAPPGAQRSRWIWVDGEWRERGLGQATAPSPPLPPEPPVPATAPEADTENAGKEQVDWESLASEGRQRIIHVPLPRLRNGDVRYNIAVRTGDRIWVPLGQIGDFFVMGHVNRPGVYSLNQREVTVRQAIAAAGGLSELAWPTRCEIIRRVGGDREVVIPIDLSAIFDGQMEDFMLRPDDVLNVGTSAVAPFLAQIRNAFRIAYGFGFVYDRNFADIDSYAGQQNPTDRRRATMQRRFPGLF